MAHFQMDQKINKGVTTLKELAIYKIEDVKVCYSNTGYTAVLEDGTKEEFRGLHEIVQKYDKESNCNITKDILSKEYELQEMM